MPYPVFVMTDAANTAITATVLNGLRITISEFRLGMDFDTPATSQDDGLKGATVFTSAPASYFYYDDNTVGIRLEIPADVGPFQFGEIGLYSDTGMLVARASLGALQDKFGPAGGGMPNIWKVTALLRFAQAPSAFLILTSSASSLLEVSHFGLLSPPGLMPSGQNAVIVHEPSPSDESVLVYRHSPTHWTINGYEKLGFITLSAQSTPGEIPSNEWAQYMLNNYQSGKYIVQTLDGDIRSIDSVEPNFARPTQSMPILPPGSVLELYGAIDQQGVHTNVPVTQFNNFVTEFNSYWAAPTGLTVADSRGLNQTPIPQSASLSSVMDSEWFLLMDAMRDYARLYGINPPIDIRGLQSDWTADYFNQLRRFNGVCDILTRIAQKKPGEVPLNSTDITTHTTSTRVSNWSDIQWDLQLAWADVNTMRAFFNGGGWVGFKADITPNNYVQAVQEKILSNLGVIRMNAFASESIGSMKIAWEEGDGALTDFGNCGFLGLGPGDKTVWSYAAVAASGAGMQSQEGVVTFRIVARRVGPTIQFSFRVQDTSLAEYINDTKGGTPSFSISFLSGRPTNGVISANPLPHPTYVELPSSTW